MTKSRKISLKKLKNSEFQEYTLSVNRVSKTTKGGRTFSFTVLTVIGDKAGHFGIGKGKASEVIEARKKAVHNAKSNVYEVCLTETKTIPHEITSKFCASRVILRPAKKGTGVIAGGVSRSIFKAIGIKDIVAKIIGSSNSYNVSYCVFDALSKLSSVRSFDNVKAENKKHLDTNKSEYTNLQSI